MSWWLSHSNDSRTLGWVGRVPNGWTVDTPLWAMFSREKNVGYPTETMLSVFRDHGVVAKESRANLNVTAEDRNIYQLVDSGWLVVNRMKAWQGSVGVSGLRGIVSGHYLCFRPQHGQSDRYLNWLLRSAVYTSAFEMLSRGVRPGQAEIDNDALRALPIVLPPVEEQRRIADFLDAATARIDRLVELRERQMDLATERNQAAVFEAVTGHQEPGERCESGLSWLGAIPASWAVMAVNHQYQVLLGKMLNEDAVRGAHLRPYLRNTNVQWDRIDTSDLLEMDFPPDKASRYALRAGDLMVCEGGEPGRAAIWDGSIAELYYQKALHRVRVRGGSTPRWLFYCLRAATGLNVFAVEGNVTTISHLTGEQLRAFRIPVPPRSAQARLTGMLDAQAFRHQRSEALARSQVALLAERRAALITSAVTGQLDVGTFRGVA